MENKKDLENMTNDEKKVRIEKLKREIESQREMIKSIERMNPNNGNLSFDYYQLHCMEDELSELESSLR